SSSPRRSRASCRSCAGSRCVSSRAWRRRSTGRRRWCACTATRSTPRPCGRRSAASSRTSTTSRRRARKSSASCWRTPRPETEAMSGAHGLAAQLARFAGALRARGFRVGLSEETDATAALALIDLLDRAEVHRTLRIAFRLPREAWEIFDRLFEEYWDGRRAPHHPALDEAMKRESAAAQWRWDGQRVRLEMPQERERPEGDTPGYSPEAALRRKPFEQFSESDIAAMERLVAQLAQRLATRPSRRPGPAAPGARGPPRRLQRALASARRLPT